MTVNRFCSSGLQTIALAAQRIMSGEAEVIVAGGLESCSLVQDAPRQPVYEDWLKEHKPELWMSMIETADNVAARYGVTRDQQDAYALESQRRTASAQQARKFDGEIVPLPSIKKIVDKDTKAESKESVTLTKEAWANCIHVSSGMSEWTVAGDDIGLRLRQIPRGAGACRLASRKPRPRSSAARCSSTVAR